jgi:hypothetical protein
MNILCFMPEFDATIHNPPNFDFRPFRAMLAGDRAV